MQLVPLHGGGASTLFYRPYESWAHTAEWRVTLPAGEEAAAVAAGASWVAAVGLYKLNSVYP
jgi:chromosome transmission fidelity protein 4